MRSLPLPSLLLPVLIAPALPAQFGWTTPVPEAVLNSASSDTGPHLSIDGLTIHFSSNRPGPAANYEIFSATRTGPGAPWSAPVQEAALGDPTTTDDQPFLDASGTEIYFGSLRAGGAGGFDLMVATRAGIGAPWGAPAFLTAVNSSGSESAPSLTADGLELYMLTTGWGAPFAPNNAIFRATRASTAAPFGTPAAVTELLPASSTSSHRDCEVAADGLSIVYTQSISGRLQVLQATRTSRSLPFGAPVILTDFGAVSTGVFSITRSLDGHEAFLAANFTGVAQEILTSGFEGLTQSGAAGIGSIMNLHYRDSANPGKVYVYGAALGTTGFLLGTRLVPLDPDWLLIGTLGQNIPPYTAGWVGVLDAGGNALGTLTNVTPALTGFPFHVGALTFHPPAPFGVATISNTIAVVFQ
jgi:hypothetical protein